MRTATTLSVVVLAAGGIGHALVTGLDTGITRVDPFKDMKNRPQGGHGLNILLVGTDGRDRITPEEKERYRLGGEPCHCTDTVMLVHLSADRDRASVVSLPRDSYAEMPEHTDLTTGRIHHAHPVKLNAAYAEGGPGLTVRTVESMTGVKIDHYLEVDFTSFMRTVDAVGGVRVCTTDPLKDSYTGLDLPAGPHELNGGQALQYVRSRHVDGAADLGRMQRQQKFLAALVDRATGGGVLLNPVRFREVVGSMLSSVRADQGFGTEQMLTLAKAMRGFTPASSEFVSVPLGDMSFQVKGIGSTVKWDASKAQRLFESLREDRPLAPAPAAASAAAPRPAATATPAGPRPVEVDVSPKKIRVQVYNGTHTAGLGGRVDAALRATGFDTTGTPRTATPQTGATPQTATTPQTGPSAGTGTARTGAAQTGTGQPGTVQTGHPQAATAPSGPPPDQPDTVVAYDPRWDRSARALAAALPGAALRPVPNQGGVLHVTVGADYRGVTPVRDREAESEQPEALRGDQVVCPEAP